MAMTGNMSRDTHQVERAPLKEAYHHNVYFKHWTMEEVLREAAPDFSPSIEEDEKVEGVQFMLMLSMQGYAFKSKQKREVHQLAELGKVLSPLLGLFGIKMTVNSPPQDDVEFANGEDENKQEAFVVAEGKDVQALPTKPLPAQFSHKLCIFGFATWLVARYNITPSDSVTAAEVEEKVEKLTGKLKLTPGKTDDIEPSVGQIPRNLHPQEDEGEDEGEEETEDKGEKDAKKRAKRDVAWNELSDYAKEILNDTGASNLEDVISAVLEERGKRTVNAPNALQLWGAVMQACGASVRKARKYSIVMTVRFFWYVRLDADPCQVYVSDPVAVGSPGSNLKLLQFLRLAERDGEMPGTDGIEWEEVFGYIPSRAAGPLSSRESTRTSSSKPAKRHKAARDDEGAKDSKAPRGGKHATYYAGEIGTPIDESSTSTDHQFLARDKYAVVPYFFQINDVVGELGSGRCGVVQKIRWGSDFAAKKEYMLDPYDDHRDSQKVFMHELKVLYELRDLWGKYVPAVLFHKDGLGRQYLGLQVGDPMPSDWSDWSQAEKQQAQEAIAAVEGKGWHQGDLEARNFVRLISEDGKATSIAMIDFEDASRIKNQ
jgi:hypothetical protein